MPSLAKNLLSIRAQLGINQVQLAKLLYIKQGYLSRLENGKSPINERLIVLITAQLGCPIECITKGTPLPEECITQNLKALRMGTDKDFQFVAKQILQELKDEPSPYASESDKEEAREILKIMFERLKEKKNILDKLDPHERGIEIAKLEVGLQLFYVPKDLKKIMEFLRSDTNP